MSEAFLRQSLENLTLEPNEDLNLENDLLDHVLLPRLLPQTKRNNLHDLELDLLSRMAELVEVQDEWIPAPTVKMFENLYHVQAECQPETIFEQINDLKPGGTFALFVKGQNCVFVVYMPLTDDNDQPEPDDLTTVIVATFPGSMDPKDIYKNFGDFEVSFFYSIQIIPTFFYESLKIILTQIIPCMQGLNVK